MKQRENSMSSIQIIGIKGLPTIKEGDNLAELICQAAERQKTPLQDIDIIVVSHVIASRAEGRVVNLDEIKSSPFVVQLAETLNKDPRLVENILRESRGIVRMGDGKLITETKHGFICANSGVEKKNSLAIP